MGDTTPDVTGRHRTIAEDGPGWAVLDHDGEPKPGRWATEDDATELGLAGRYLLSGFTVEHVTA
jgi:hypothetical protein